MENNLKEQKGLEILDLNNLEDFVTKCINLPEDFKSQSIREDTNGLTLLILQVGDRIPKLLSFQDNIERDTYEEEAQIAFCKFLGFDDDEHLCEWLGENPQWAPENWCGSSYCIFENSVLQGFVSAKVSSYDDLINELCALYDTYNFKVYNRTNPPKH
jgi:hypothetical protein